MGSYFPDQRLNPASWQWKPGVLTTGQPENSLVTYFKYSSLYMSISSMIWWAHSNDDFICVGLVNLSRSLISSMLSNLWPLLPLIEWSILNSSSSWMPSTTFDSPDNFLYSTSLVSLRIISIWFLFLISKSWSSLEHFCSSLATVFPGDLIQFYVFLYYHLDDFQICIFRPDLSHEFQPLFCSLLYPQKRDTVQVLNQY